MTWRGRVCVTEEAGVTAKVEPLAWPVFAAAALAAHRDGQPIAATDLPAIVHLDDTRCGHHHFAKHYSPVPIGNPQAFISVSEPCEDKTLRISML